MVFHVNPLTVYYLQNMILIVNYFNFFLSLSNIAGGDRFTNEIPQIV